MGGQASLLDGTHKGPGPNKTNVTGSALNVINNKSQLSEADLAVRTDREEKYGGEKKDPPFVSIKGLNLAFYY